MYITKITSFVQLYFFTYHNAIFSQLHVGVQYNNFYYLKKNCVVSKERIECTQFNNIPRYIYIPINPILTHILYNTSIQHLTNNTKFKYFQYSSPQFLKQVHSKLKKKSKDTVTQMKFNFSF